MDDAPEFPDTQENTQEEQEWAPPLRATPDPDLWGYLQRYPGNTLVPEERYYLYRNQPEVTIGRAPTSAIRIPSPKSATHATLRWEGVHNGVSRVTIEDSGSKNHTFVDGTVLKARLPRAIKHEAEISFAQPQPPPPGNTTMEDFRFTFHDLASPKRGVVLEYDIQEELGRGCYGQVFKAYARRDGSVFAVKCIGAVKSLKLEWNERGETVSNHPLEIQIRREIDIMKTLDHPNICRLQTYYWNADKSVDIVLEYMAAGDLGAFITVHGGLSERMTKHLMRQLCEALAFIHSHNITHRDLKPENTLLTTDKPPVLKLADFGLAKLVDPAVRMTTICGTPMYLAPEFVLHMINNTGYNFTIDVWACGIVMHACIACLRALFLDMPEGSFRMEDVRPDRRIDWASLDEKVLGVDKEGYATYLSSEGRRFIRGLLEWQPESRLTMARALKHKWLRYDRADSYAPPASDACDELSSSLEDVTMRTDAAPSPRADDADVTPNATRRHATEPPAQDMAPGLTRLKNKGRLLERQSEMLARAPQSQTLYRPLAEQIERAQELPIGPTCSEPGLSGANKRKRAPLTPPAGDTGTVQNTPFRTVSPSPGPVLKRGRSVKPDEMDVSPQKKIERRRGGR
ncbi:kinase-like domain-containing protein [Mycena maculata]|uniref:Kinase-like domain-containing protein n=1 Tax=Mycena maculata TaxID=230809 RepID=A0AAD7P0A8_9AGAR|nr:kinase-like domain-containing protein [Mycena maculata]